MGRLIHKGLGSSSLIAHVLHSPPPPREQLCNRSCSNKHTHLSIYAALSTKHINRRGGSSPLRFVERQDEGRARGCAPVPGQGIGAALRCLFTHPPGATNSTLPKNLHNSQGFKDIHGNLYVWRYIWEYVCVEERASEAPPAVVRRICGYVEII